jgi:hypothetical protein
LLSLALEFMAPARWLCSPAETHQLAALAETDAARKMPEGME